MAETQFTRLTHRALFTLGGEDRKSFLQGLVSNDVNRIDSDHGLYGAFLTPQGKFLHEFFAAERQDVLWLETEALRLPDFIRRLSLYKLRSKVTLGATPDWQVYAITGPEAARVFDLTETPGAARAFADGLVLLDPRLAQAGVRAWLPGDGAAALTAAGLVPAGPEQWDRDRIALGLADGSRDMTPEKALLLENGFDELGGVDWNKGCYLGQELTARTKYRGLVKKRLLPVTISGPAPEAGAPILLEGVEAGEMRSHAGDLGLALLRLEALGQWTANGGVLAAGDAVLSPTTPSWVRLPDTP
jgi:hypothetical protein